MAVANISTNAGSAPAMYTENGNDVFGAIIDGAVWNGERDRYGLIWRSGEELLFNNTAGDTVALRLQGMTSDGRAIGIEFVLSQVNIQSARLLGTLRDTKFPLGSPRARVFVSREGGCATTTSGVGQIHFRSVKFEQSNATAFLSGTFGFAVDDPDCGQMRVEYGRFDLTITAMSHF